MKDLQEDKKNLIEQLTKNKIKNAYIPADLDKNKCLQMIEFINEKENKLRSIDKSVTDCNLSQENKKKQENCSKFLRVLLATVIIICLLLINPFIFSIVDLTNTDGVATMI